MLVARHVRVTGRVQGVWFRAWTREQANELGVSGWVQNCLDGSVEVHLEGEDDAVRRMICMLGVGPPNAQVDTIQESEELPQPLEGFQIRH